jgi:O-antigen ligase
MTTVDGIASAEDIISIASPSTPLERREKTPLLLAFLCLLIPALPSFVTPFGPLKSYGSPAKVIAVLFFGLAILGFFFIRRTAATRTLRPGAMLILVFFLAELVLFGVGLARPGSWLIEANANRALFTILAFTGVTLYVMTRIETARQRTVLLGCLAISLTFCCVVGLLQTTGFDMRFFFQPPGFFANLEDISLADRHGVIRVAGTSITPLEFSVLATVAVLLNIHFACYAASRQVRWLAMLACGVALLALPASVSRTGVIALAAGLLVYMWNFKARSLAVVVAGATVGVLLYIAAFPDTANAMWQTNVNSEHDSSVSWRTDDYAVVGDIFRAHPLFGLGLGATASSVYEHSVLDNEWLSALVQGGIIGIIAMIVIAAGGILGISAALRTASTPLDRGQAYLIGSILIAILSSSFTMDLFYCQQAVLIFFISFGLLWSNFKVSLPESSTPSRVYALVE